MPMAFTTRTSATMGDLSPSLTLGITAKAKAMQAAGLDVVSMCAGEPDFDTPAHIKAAAARALEAGDTKYTPTTGRLDLREAIARKFVEENGIPCKADQVIVGPGAKFSVFSAIAALCGPGDEVLIPSPFWLSYSEMVHAAGATAVLVPTRLENGYALDPGALRDYLTPSSKLLILNSPSNPTGAVCPRQVLTEVAELAVRHGFMVLADEIYEKLVYDAGFEHVSIASLNPEIRERTVTVNGFSKAYSMTGWRLGYLTGPLWLVKRISALQDHTTSNPTSFAQAGALAALTGPQEPVEDMRRAFAARRDRIYELLSQIPNLKVPKPHGAFYIFPDISAYGLGSMAFVEKMLEKVRLAAIPGKPFGADNCVRLSYACSLDSIEKACARLAEFCRSL